ncbi:TolC family protein [Massilia cavernae]|uniref:TolC family protein n=1 Tax=Massilia cavernae TaxID=2320864 RepID=A0A418Y8L5_9BURK|nr:TolC family protein [Massilia cavernae]RJG27912.1 TolC family protein [Massilia cavernae]
MNTTKRLPFLRPVAMAAATLVLTGCASFSRDGGLDSVSALTTQRTGQAVQFSKSEADTSVADQKVSQLLSAPLSAETAVQVALLNNRGLQASLAELGVAEADLVQAGRMANPSFSFGRLAGGHDVEIERSVMFDIVGLLTIPLRSGIESRRFEIAKLQAASEAVRLASETRKAYFNAVAARQTALYMEQVRTSAEASAELAKRMAEVGNFSKLDQAREQAFYADATAQVARSRHNATVAREQLVRLMGVWGLQTGLALPDRLPDLPQSTTSENNIETLAMEQRLDVQVAKRDADMTARALGLSKATGVINVMHAGYVNSSKTGSPRENGYEIELELPIFDWGRSRVAKAQAIYMQSVHRTADAAIRARSEVREAYSAYRTSHDLAKHYRDEVVPLRKKISDEMLLRYNGMLIGVFELLADARTQVNSVNSAIEAQRDFWIAETELQAAVNGAGGGASKAMGTQASGEAAPAH